VTLVRVGALPNGLPEEIAGFLGERTKDPCVVSPDILDPGPAYDPIRGQFDCRRLLPALGEHLDADRSLVLGMADVDLFSAIFTFVLGEAKLGGRTGIFSLYRLHPSFYGLPEDMDLLESRARKESLHELGHLRGLIHCRSPECVMRFSAAAEEVDLKPDSYCPSCLGRIAKDDQDGSPGDIPSR
jgi:archaemetzincin